MGKTYKDSGVNIEAGDEFIHRIKTAVDSTKNEKVLSSIGVFAGLYDGVFKDISHPVLVSSVDGVGTKLKVAIMMDKHDSIGQDIVNHCVNDILTCGASPLFFLDYLAVSKLDIARSEKVVSGIAKACKENQCALIGGETAEMPDIYHDGDYDLAGTIIGVVNQKDIINGNEISEGDVMIGLPSVGLHTNGFSLARKVLFPKFKVDQVVEELGESVGEALLKVHKSYLHTVKRVLTEFASSKAIVGLAHITGGGAAGNTQRILPEGLVPTFDFDAFPKLPIFELIRTAGHISDQEMRKVFNCGIGWIFIVKRDQADKVLSNLKHHREKPVVIGDIERAHGVISLF